MGSYEPRERVNEILHFLFTLILILMGVLIFWAGAWLTCEAVPQGCYVSMGRMPYPDDADGE